MLKLWTKILAFVSNFVKFKFLSSLITLKEQFKPEITKFWTFFVTQTKTEISFRESFLVFRLNICFDFIFILIQLNIQFSQTQTVHWYLPSHQLPYLITRIKTTSINSKLFHFPFSYPTKTRSWLILTFDCLPLLFNHDLFLQTFYSSVSNFSKVDWVSSYRWCSC